MKRLELLAPARNKDIGIAAIDCGADAVYIGGPAFGARYAAGNSIEDIAILCNYAHKFGAKVFLTVNTLLRVGEIEEARRIMLDAQDAGVDAFIVQDEALFRTPGISVPLHASTQCSIRSLDTARHFESLGAGRLVLEREMDLDTLRSISKGTSCEIEFFVHGALCVCYSGQCYLSESICGRSANRGDCIQACRSLYDLVDENGKVLALNKALLSLKDYNLIGRLGDLAEAGVSSFKIEGRLKNISYVRNTVLAYSRALDKLVAAQPQKYCRASFGKVTEGFSPCLEKSFNRGFTELFLDGERGRWSSMDAPKSMGEYLGTLESVSYDGGSMMKLSIRPASPSLHLSNGDGFSIVCGSKIVGFRGDVCNGRVILAKRVQGPRKGDRIFRNVSLAFEKGMDANPCRREIAVEFSVRFGDGSMSVAASSEDGRSSRTDLDLCGSDRVRDCGKFLSTLRTQLQKRHLHYVGNKVDLVCPEGVEPRFISISAMNELRRSLIEAIDNQPVKAHHLAKGQVSEEGPYGPEVSHSAVEELMRTKYCIRYEMGLCLRDGADPCRLFLVNNGRRFPLGFDCRNCEMTVLKSS